MKTKFAKVSVMVLSLIIIISVLSACGGNRPPNGRYEAVDETVALVTSAIIIDGNNLTIVTLGSALSYRYSFNSNTGVITLSSDVAGVSLIEYRNGSIWFGGAEFRR